ncbi:MAG: PTS system mannose/fructose/sorbose family transporter subunit IID [Clostridium sp.]
MSLVQALLIAIVMGLLLTENLGYGHIQISRPVFAGPIIGLLMGDLQTGLIVGGTVELMFMGVFPVGGSVPPNAQFAGMMSTVLAIASGSKPEVGIALAYPIGVFAQFVLLLDYNLNLVFIHGADRKIKEGNIDAVNSHLYMCVLGIFLTWTFSSFLGTYFGATWVESLYNTLPEFIRRGLSIAGGIMPAMGMAMLLKMMDFKKLWCFFAIGYVLSAYLGLSILAIAILSIAVVFAIYILGKKDDETEVEDEVEDEVEEKSQIPQNSILTKKDLNRINLRSYLLAACLNYERYQGLGYCYTILPALKKLYKGDDLKEAVIRNTEFYNSHLWVNNIVVGVSVALEEQRALGQPITGQVISATKAGLMGPLAGLGDSFFKGVVVTITGAFAASLAIDGNPIAPFVFIIPNLIICILTKYYGTMYGYKFGTKVIMKLKKSNVIQKLIDSSTIVGLMVAAGLVTNYVKISLTKVLNFGGKEIILDDLVNSLLPKLLPYAMVFLYYYIIKKFPKKGLYITLILTFVIGILGAFFNIL